MRGVSSRGAGARRHARAVEAGARRMTGTASAPSVRGRAAPHRGALGAMVGATLLWGGTFVAIRDSVAAVPPATLVCVQSFVAAAILAPFADPPARALAFFRGADLARFAYLAVAGSTVAPLLQVYAQRTLSAGRVGLLFALEPLFALLFAITLGGEHFTPRWWLGAALIVGAVVLVEG